MENAIHSSMMLCACGEARRWLGATSPNPPVGAVGMDEGGKILALAAHRRAGTEHAEAALLRICREQGSIGRLHTIYVTLEPCNHFGRTPPCSEALIEAGVKRVVVGVRDPNPEVTGGGCERLRQAGIEVIEDVEAEACRRLIHAFAFYALNKRPFVTVKRAFDTQGSMIPPEGQKVFTSPESLRLAHRMRKKADAIVTGSGTVLADKPLFTVRHVNDFKGKQRVLAILDRRGRVPDAYIVGAAARGFEVLVMEDLDSCFLELGNRGIRDILVEAGPILSQSVLDSPHWTMKTDIYAGNGAPDRVEVAFNPEAKIPFKTDGLRLEDILPS